MDNGMTDFMRENELTSMIFYAKPPAMACIDYRAESGDVDEEEGY